MDKSEVRQALATVDLRPQRVEPILGGWSSWTFDLDGTHIARFPRHHDIADATRRELALLPELARHVSFAVPQPTHVGTWAGHPFFAYPRILGRGLRADDASPALFDRLGQALRELHAVPVDQVTPRLGTGPPEQAWRRHYERLVPIVEQHALPVLDVALADRVRRELAAFIGHAAEVPASLVHNDLGLEHWLIDDTTGELTGIIDFEDATVGDPAVDLVPLRAAFGRHAVTAILGDRDIGARLDERMHLYRWMGSVHAIIYGVTQGVAAEIISGRRELARRIDAPR